MQAGEAQGCSSASGEQNQPRPELGITPSPTFSSLKGCRGGGCLPGDGYYLAIGGAVAQHNWSHITSVLQDMKLQCKLLDCSEELGMMSIQGPLR